MTSMHHYTHNNHYRFGFDGTDWAITSRTDDAVYHWSMGSIRRRIGFRDSCVEAARTIADSTVGRICVALSGGMDSELICRSLMAAGVDFHAATVRFTDGSNMHDIRHGLAFCKEHGIRQEVLDINILDFMHDGMWDYIREFHITSPQFPLHLWLVDQVDDHLIFGGGDLNLTRPIGQPDGYYNTINPHTSLVHRMMMARGKTGSPYFYAQIPEQAWSVINDDLTRMWLRHSFSMKQHTMKYFKPLLYEKHFPGLVPRQKKTGFERMEQLDLEIRQRLQSMHGQYMKGIRIPLDEFNSILEGQTCKIYRNDVPGSDADQSTGNPIS